MEKEHEKYVAYNCDRLTEGSEIKIEHTIYYRDDPDLSDLISKTPHEVMAMRKESAAAEQAAYNKVREAAKEWERAASVTNRFDRALEYLKTPEVSHSFNNWVKDEYGGYDYISNKVYKMRYQINEHSHWRDDTIRYTVKWSIYTNSPSNGYDINRKVAGQERTFKDKAAAEKYLQGRIKAYEYLFEEISPPIPQEYVDTFKVNGMLLPGYNIEKTNQKRV